MFTGCSPDQQCKTLKENAYLSCWCSAGHFEPWTIRTMDCSYLPELFVSWTSSYIPFLDFSYPGLFVPWTVRTLLDCSYHGLFVPSLDDSYHVQKGYIVYTVQVNSPEVFWYFFPKWLRIFSPNFTRLLPFLPTVDYKFLFNYLQLWQWYAILRQPSVRFGRWWTFWAWWVALNMA